MDPIKNITDSLYILKVFEKEEIKNLIMSIKSEKNNIRNIELDITQDLQERNIETLGGEILIEKKMKFIDEFIKFLVYWYKKEALP